MIDIPPIGSLVTPNGNLIPLSIYSESGKFLCTFPIGSLSLVVSHDLLVYRSNSSAYSYEYEGYVKIVTGNNVVGWVYYKHVNTVKL